MSKSLSLGQLWMLEQMIASTTGTFSTIHPYYRPVPATMQELRGLEKRGLCCESHRCIFTISEKGRAAFTDGRKSLDDFRSEQTRKAEAEWEKEDAAWGISKEVR